MCALYHHGVPGGPGRPGGPGENMGDVRSFSRVICSWTAALFDSTVILNQDAGNSDWGQREISKHLKSRSIKSTIYDPFSITLKSGEGNWTTGQTFRKHVPAPRAKCRPWRTLSDLFGTSPDFDSPAGICCAAGAHRSRTMCTRIQKTYARIRAHASVYTSGRFRVQLLISEHYAWAQLWPSAPESDPNIWPAHTCNSIASLLLCTSSIFIRSSLCNKYKAAGAPRQHSWRP